MSAVRDALERAQAVLNPASGFLKRGDRKRRQYIEESRDMIRAVLDAERQRKPLPSRRRRVRADEPVEIDTDARSAGA